MIGTPLPFDHLIRVLPLSGVREPSDVALVIEDERGALVALIDAAGQGRAAAASARRAEAIVRRVANRSVADAFLEAHRALLGNPGVSLALARLDFATSTIEFTGVGRVYGAVAGSVERVLHSEPGTVGVGLPKVPSPVAIRAAPGDLVVLAVDGVVDVWDLAKLWRRTDQPPLAALARSISGLPDRMPDDGSVVLARLP